MSIMNIDMEFRRLVAKCDVLLESNGKSFGEKGDLEAIVN
jgi:hypothetical protein